MAIGPADKNKVVFFPARIKKAMKKKHKHMKISPNAAYATEVVLRFLALKILNSIDLTKEDSAEKLFSMIRDKVRGKTTTTTAAADKVEMPAVEKRRKITSRMIMLSLSHHPEFERLFPIQKFTGVGHVHRLARKDIEKLVETDAVYKRNKRAEQRESNKKARLLAAKERILKQIQEIDDKVKEKRNQLGSIEKELVVSRTN